MRVLRHCQAMLSWVAALQQEVDMLHFRADSTHSEQPESVRHGRQSAPRTTHLRVSAGAAGRSPHRPAATPSSYREAPPLSCEGGTSFDEQRGARQPIPAASAGARRGAAGGSSALPAEEELFITVARGKRPLGLVLNTQNLVTEVSPGAPAEGHLQVGDRLVEIDGVALRGRPAHTVLTAAPSHTFRVRRRNSHVPAGPWA